MVYRTYGALKTEVLMETDTEAEDFLQADEIMAYFQDAVNECQAHIHKLGLEDDYFLKKKTDYSLTNGQSVLDMPSDIYAAKIRGLIYSYGGRIYPIKRMKGPKRFELLADLLQNPGQNTPYVYQIINTSSAAGLDIDIYPRSYETSTNCITMHYIREAVTIVDDNSVVDIPQFYSFIKAFVKYKILNKAGEMLAADAKADLDKERVLMLETLREMTPDYDDIIPPDTSIYEEMS